MNCPVCDARLRPIEKHNVEIDICPDCKGVWLDRGELERIIEAVAGGSEPAPRPEDYRSRDERRREDRREDRRDDRDRKVEIDPRTGKPKKREGWFSEIFDSFGGD